MTILPSDFTNICDFFTAVCDAAELSSCPVVQKNLQGTNIFNSWLGFTVGDLWFRLRMDAVKATQKPMRPYVTTTEDRDRVAQRITENPKGVLDEMCRSGGWRQLDPHDMTMLMVSAAIGPEGNIMDQALHEMMEGTPKSS